MVFASSHEALKSTRTTISITRGAKSIAAVHLTALPKASQPSPSRSRSPTTSGKRTHASDDDDVRFTQAQKLNDHQGSARAKDCDVVTHRGPQMHGELITKVRVLTELIFVFESSQIQKN
ncbi:hypothetical protein B0H19DRAFT_1371418, partial [Mycena capillaripes]